MLSRQKMIELRNLSSQLNKFIETVECENCANCEYMEENTSGWCRNWNAEVPKEVQLIGCDSYMNEIPF